jgi:hypothetical protein
MPIAYGRAPIARVKPCKLLSRYCESTYGVSKRETNSVNEHTRCDILGIEGAAVEGSVRAQLHPSWLWYITQLGYEQNPMRLTGDQGTMWTFTALTRFMMSSSWLILSFVAYGLTERMSRMTMKIFEAWAILKNCRNISPGTSSKL